MATSQYKVKNKLDLFPAKNAKQPSREDYSIRRINTEANDNGPQYKRINLYLNKPPLIDTSKGILNTDKKATFHMLRAEIKPNSNSHNNNTNKVNSSSSKVKTSMSIKESGTKEASSSMVRESLQNKHPPKTLVTEPYDRREINFSKGQSKMIDNVFGRERKVISQKEANGMTGKSTFGAGGVSEIQAPTAQISALGMIARGDTNRTSSQIYHRESSVSKKQSTVLKGASLYSYDEVVGSGTFGTVYKGRNKQTLDVVAIKKVLQDPRYKNREHEILKELNHYNVLKMKDSFFTTENNQQFLNVIMDYFPDTAYSVIKKYSKNRPTGPSGTSSSMSGGSRMPPVLVKLYAYQMIRSLLYLEKISICHRDIKPQNILIDTETNHLVMCDFGSAKRLVPGEPNISYICSRCYRAPELIFGATQYTNQIDMWSVGCVIIEMLVFEPIFMANSNLDQLVEIIKIIGTPSQREVLAMNPEYDMNQYTFPKIPPKDWKKVIKEKVEPQLISLITEIMRYDPHERLSPFKALCHPYFDELRDQRTHKAMCRSYAVPDLFNFNSSDCTKQQLKALVPVWCRS